MESENIEVLFIPVTDEVSIPSPTNKSRRNKAQEIIRRKSGLNLPGVNIRSVSKLKRRRTIHDSAGDHSSASEVDDCKLQTKPKAPSRNKKAEMIFIRAGTHSRTGSPRSSVGSMNSSKRRKFALVNAKQQLIYHERRPSDLPRNYNIEDEEFMCLCCQKLKRWDNGVWRCAMWPSFDICDDCGRNELIQGKTRVQNTFPKHHRLSQVPLMTDNEQPKETEMNIQNIHEEHQMMIDNVRRSLSLVIETLNIEVCNRLDNIKSLSKNDNRMELFYIQSDEDFKQCEIEISEWRKVMATIDEQEERLKRRSKNVLLTNIAGYAYSPTPTELESDEELFANLKEYDYTSDFSFINRKLSLVSDLFWREDALLKQMQSNLLQDAKAEYMDIEEQYKITIDDLEQQCLEAQQKVLNNDDDEYEDSEREFNDNKYERYALKRYEQNNDDGISLEQFELAIHEMKLKYESQIDNYIEQFARKDAQYQDAQQQILILSEPKQKAIKSSKKSTEEIYHQLQDEKQMNAKLQQELNTLSYQNFLHFSCIYNNRYNMMISCDVHDDDECECLSIDNYYYVVRQHRNYQNKQKSSSNKQTNGEQSSNHRPININNHSSSSITNNNGGGSSGGGNGDDGNGHDRNNNNIPTDYQGSVVKQNEDDDESDVEPVPSAMHSPRTTTNVDIDHSNIENEDAYFVFDNNNVVVTDDVPVYANSNSDITMIENKIEMKDQSYESSPQRNAIPSVPYIVQNAPSQQMMHSSAVIPVTSAYNARMHSVEIPSPKDSVDYDLVQSLTGNISVPELQILHRAMSPAPPHNSMLSSNHSINNNNVMQQIVNQPPIPQMFSPTALYEMFSSPTQVPQIASQQTIADLFVDDGKEYWANVANSANVPQEMYTLPMSFVLYFYILLYFVFLQVIKIGFLPSDHQLIHNN